jgi:peptidoglycan/LPS O-acetylase OafA/YrhL
MPRSMDSAESNDSRRLDFLDGLRGIAAADVVVHHFVAAFRPDDYFRVEGVVASLPLVLLNGPFAVFVFFALSGFVLSYSIERRRPPMLTLAGRRFLRLAVPMLASTWLAWALLSTWGPASQRVAAAIGNGWLRGFYSGDGALTLWQATIDALLNPFRFGESYSNRVLWTMQVELVGSLVLYGVCTWTRPSWRPAIFAGLVAAALVIGGRLVSYAPMFAGAILFILWRSGGMSRSGIYGAALIAGGLFCGSLAARDIRETHFAAAAEFLPVAGPNPYVWAVGAVALLTGVLMSRGIQGVLAARLPRFLGRISFALYLVHEPVLMTAICAAYISLLPSGGALFASGALYAAMVLALSWSMTRWLDEPLQARLRRMVPTYPALFLWAAGAISVAVLVAVNGRIGWNFWGTVGLLAACASLCVVVRTAQDRAQ